MFLSANNIRTYFADQRGGGDLSPPVVSKRILSLTSDSELTTSEWLSFFRYETCLYRLFMLYHVILYDKELLFLVGEARGKTDT